MRLIGIFLSACVILAIVKAAIVALLLLFLIALIWGFCLHPSETFGLLAFCAILGALNAQPVLVIAIVAVAIIIGQLTKNCDPPP